MSVCGEVCYLFGISLIGIKKAPEPKPRGYCVSA